MDNFDHTQMWVVLHVLDGVWGLQSASLLQSGSTVFGGHRPCGFWEKLCDTCYGHLLNGSVQQGKMLKTTVTMTNRESSRRGARSRIKRTGARAWEAAICMRYAAIIYDHRQKLPETAPSWREEGSGVWEQWRPGGSMGGTRGVQSLGGKQITFHFLFTSSWNSVFPSVMNRDPRTRY